MVGSYCPYVSGPVLVKVNLRDGAGWQNLGYTTEGVQVEEHVHTNPIHADAYGGSAGPEVDRQFLGKSARISLSMPIYSLTVMKKMRESQASTNWSSGDPGTLVNIGGLITCGNTGFQLLLQGSIDQVAVAANPAASVMAKWLNFPNCWYDGPIRYTIGAKNTVFDLDIKATPFTSDATNQGGDGLTRLWMENENLVTNMGTYAGTSQAA